MLQKRTITSNFDNNLNIQPLGTKYIKFFQSSL